MAYYGHHHGHHYPYPYYGYVGYGGIYGGYGVHHDHSGGYGGVHHRDEDQLQIHVIDSVPPTKRGFRTISRKCPQNKHFSIR
ncbi:hypothetical protein [Paenibacillus sp. GP183]|jgi:hypothetical protein|uniref:hypothetical protein n=1 Tax=Paenibacillus sp. GP183 TaxID=1882751 RepID=UPI00089A9AB6|nr:hypothetical protein [Paenibacillus sp. GP183]SEC60522.1 hypothetical protein SAMN05443246_4673 [Paenibacillus sp. GP183]